MPPGGVGAAPSDRFDHRRVALRVAHVAKLRTGDYFVGGQFDRPLTADEMRPFLGDAAGV